MTLEQIAIKHKTAKVPHGYMPIYEKYLGHLRDKPFDLLEIGVAEGASLRTWREYFPNANITGVDKHEPNTQLSINGVEIICHDSQTLHHNPDFAHRRFDVIIDDASHIAEEQLQTFWGLWDFVKPGGYYIIEDLFTLFDPEWNPVIRNVIDIIKQRFQSILIGGDSIQEFHLYGRNDINGIMFLRKRYEEFRIQPLSEFQNL